MAEKVKTTKASAAPRKTAAKKKAASLESVTHNEIQPQPVQHHQEPAAVHDQDIQKLAHHYWIERGHPHGDADADWFRAEQELRGKAS